MNFSRLMIANAVFALLGSLVLILVPAQMMAPYGIRLDQGGVFLANLMGSVLLGLAVLYYLLRNVKDREVVRAISLTAVVAHGLSVVFGVLAVMSNTLNSMVWVDIILHAVFAGGFWYYGLNKK